MNEAVVMLILRGSRILAARRGPEVSDTGYWTFPTGSVEAGESQVETVEREAFEELGIQVRALRKVWECPTDDDRYLLHWWTTDVDDTVMRLEQGEVDAVRWVDADEFLELSPTFAGDRHFVRDVLPTLGDP